MLGLRSCWIEKRTDVGPKAERMLADKQPQQKRHLVKSNKILEVPRNIALKTVAASCPCRIYDGTFLIKAFFLQSCDKLSVETCKWECHLQVGQNHSGVAHQHFGHQVVGVWDCACQMNKPGLPKNRNKYS